MAQHATLTTMREINASVVLDAIRADPPLSRAEVSRRTGMTKPTVANALDLLLAAGLVQETEPPAGETHYGAVYFEPLDTLAHVLALDIGTRFVRGAVSDLSGAVVARYDERIDGPAPDVVLAGAHAVRDRLTRDGPPLELAVAGVPGVVDPEEGVIRESNRAALEGMAIRTELGAVLGVATEVENDINLAAIGEHASGAGKEVDDFVFLSIGTGVGAGLILGGRPHRGSRGAAGEVDNPAPGAGVAPDSPSADALLTWAAEWIADRAKPGSALAAARPGRVTAEAIFAADRAGDPLAARILVEQARRTAVRIAEIVRVTDVELVVLGGGVGLACTQILPRIEAELRVLLRHPPRVAVSSLGDAPVLVGAMAMGSRLARQRYAERCISDVTAGRS
ncbi:ROK family protein [Actinomadura macra]|uniref:ROK family protein n=1 Tax=Actinomadura macra TaxID=46164 RepID=UPI000830C423|nr:ROK family protein [Actinomadura macra]